MRTSHRGRPAAAGHVTFIRRPRGRSRMRLSREAAQGCKASSLSPPATHSMFSRRLFSQADSWKDSSPSASPTAAAPPESMFNGHAASASAPPLPPAP
eukprot:6678777-Prymnesium_polylepis.1